MNDRELCALQWGDSVRFGLRPLSDLIDAAERLGIAPRDLLVTGAVVPRDEPASQHSLIQNEEAK